MFDKSIMDALGITEEMVSTEEGFYEACEIVKNSGIYNRKWRECDSSCSPCRYLD